MESFIVGVRTVGSSRPTISQPVQREFKKGRPVAKALRTNVRVVIRIWLVEAIFGNSLAAWEIYGEEPNTPWHTISYWSYLYQGLGWAIALVMLGVLVWWIWHFHHPRVK